VRDNPSMQAAFPLVLYGSIALFVVVGVWSMLTRSNLYDQVGQDGLFLGEDQFGGGLSEPLGSGESDGSGRAELQAHTEREREIRQMLQARSDRLVRKGQAPLDIDAELAKLERAGPPRPGEPGAGGLGSTDGPGGHDAGLTEEVRQLVVARNERRRRQGQDPLDVDAEVQRTLAELDP
jgi:hypothetical protein